MSDTPDTMEERAREIVHANEWAAENCYGPGSFGTPGWSHSHLCSSLTDEIAAAFREIARTARAEGAREEREAKWQPIETAPKDRPILVCGGTVHYHDDSVYPYEGECDYVQRVAWVNRHGGYWEGPALEGYDNYIEHRPLYWTDIPELPEAIALAPAPRRLPNMNKDIEDCAKMLCERDGVIDWDLADKTFRTMYINAAQASARFWLTREVSEGMQNRGIAENRSGGGVSKTFDAMRRAQLAELGLDQTEKEKR